MSKIVFADAALQFLNFETSLDSEALALDLIDTPWVQRLRDIKQTGNTQLVYMFSEHSRFGHSLGVAFLANLVMRHLSEGWSKEVQEYRMAISAAALLHDFGHIAPGSHTAYKAWFPDGPDIHEDVGIRIILEDKTINSILKRYRGDLPEMVAAILAEEDSVPPWTWEIISGGGWNVDRGNWCLVDSVMAGVSYGRYNVPALVESIVLTKDGHLAVRESRLDALTHFAVARQAMYRQVYQHRVILATDTLNGAIAKRVRQLGSKINFADPVMQKVLQSKSPLDLALEDLFWMTESWWRYHLTRWARSDDKILSDLSSRMLFRKLFKTVRINRGDDLVALKMAAIEAVKKAGYDPEYYLHEASSVDLHTGDSKRSMLIELDDGSIQTLAQAEPLIDAMLMESKSHTKSWLVMPKEAKDLLGRTR